MSDKTALRLVVSAEDRLAALAVEARAAHEDFTRSHIVSAQRAVDAGRALFAARDADEMPRGGYDRWVEGVAGIPKQTANYYLRLFVAVEEGRLTLDDIAQAGQTGALRASSAKNHRAQGTGENEWFTPKQYIDAARAVMGGIDLDPASHDVAQETIKATEYFTIEDDGLTQDWHGRVWLNPPYARGEIDAFVTKLVDELDARRVSEAIMLTHSYTDTTWFQVAADRAAMICFTFGRVRFVSPFGEVSNPTQGQAFFYFGENLEEFSDTFKQFGFVVDVIEAGPDQPV